MTLRKKLVIRFSLILLTELGVVLSVSSGLLEFRRDIPPSLMIATGIGLLVCILAGLYAADLLLRNTISPLDQLGDALRRAGKGDLSQRLEIDGDEEIRFLAQGFNELAETLKKEQEALLKSEQKYETIMGAMKEQVYIRSHDYKVSYMNDAMIKAIGRNAVGEHCYAALYNLEAPCPWCPKQDMDKGRYFETELVSPRDNRVYHISNAPMTMPGKPLSFMKVFRDVTPIKDMENQVMQAQKLEALVTLTGGIAHDFNNILFPIMGYAEMALDELGPDNPLRENLTMIMSNANRAKTLVNQLLAFCRQEESDPLPLHAQLVVKEALKLIRSSLPATITLTTAIDNNCPPVMADPSQIHQIIMNLTANAMTATQNGKGAITVSLNQVDLDQQEFHSQAIPAGSYVCLTVTDTGQGMSDNVIHRIFDPFFTTKEIGKGSGMGLSIVHGIVKKLNGHIRVYSQKNKGTEFQVLFPAIDPGTEDNRTDQEFAPRGNGETILVVDDQSAIISTLTELLTKSGYAVIGENDPANALERFRKDPYAIDLVVTDQTMPVMTGMELTRELLSLRPDLPVILCSGFSEQATPEKIQAAGLKGFLSKPILKKDLTLLVHRLLIS